MQKIITKSLDGPSPPSGSDWDQSTLNYSVDGSLPVQNQHPVAQTIINERKNLTGFGVLAGYTEQGGSVTEPLEIMIVTPQGPAGFKVYPNEIEPEYYYYLGVDFPDTPITFPDKQLAIILGTSNTSSDTHGWIWAGLTGNKYTNGLIKVYDNGDWLPFDDLDSLFWTFTETTSPPPPPDKTIGDFGGKTKWYSGPYPAGSSQSVCNIHAVNTGNKTGVVRWEMYEYPDGANKRIVSGQQELGPGEGREFTPQINIPNTPGETWPLGVKIWGEDESKPSWGIYRSIDTEVLY